MMNLYKKVFYCASWIPFFILKLCLAILGLVAVPMALGTRYVTIEDYDEDHWPDLFWIWGNDEEGVPEWWFVRANQEWYTRYWPRFWWYAIRNPVNNFRFLFEDYSIDQVGVETNWDFDAPMEATQMMLLGQASAFRWVWKGWKAGFRRVWLNNTQQYSEIWFGWKLGSHVPGLGFTAQVRLKRPIGQ